MYVISAAGFIRARPLRWIKLEEAVVVALLLIFYFNIRYLNGFFLEPFLQKGLENKDTLFHSAIAAMYANYQIPSLGLDGLVKINYHVLSHRMFGGFSIYSQLSTLEVYSYSFSLLAPPALVFTFAALSRTIEPRLQPLAAAKGILAVLLFVIWTFLFEKASFWQSFIVSESFLVSEVLMTLSLIGLYRYLVHKDASLINMGCIFILFVMSGLSKATTGVLLTGTLWGIGITHARNARYWAMNVIATAALFYMLFGAVNRAVSSDSHGLIAPLEYINMYVYLPPHFADTALNKYIFFTSVYFLGIWLCIAIGAASKKLAYFRSPEFIILACLTLPCLLISAFLNFSSGNNGYFTMIPGIISVPFLIPAWNLIPDAYLEKFGARISYRNAASILIAVLLVRAHYFQSRDFYPETLRLIASTPDKLTAEDLDTIRKVRRETDKRTLVQVDSYAPWTGAFGCSAFFLIPALAERPVKNGVPTATDCPGLDGAYGLSDYIGSRQPTASDSFTVLHLAAREK